MIDFRRGHRSLGGLVGGPFPPSLHESTLLVAPKQSAIVYFDPSNSRIRARPYLRPDSPSVQAREVARATEWSARGIGRALGISHPTASRLLAGSGRHEPDLLGRLHRLYVLVTRVHALTGHSPAETSRVLLVRDERGEAAIDYARIGNLSRAYLAALDAMRPRRRDAMGVGSRPARPGGGTVDIGDDE